MLREEGKVKLCDFGFSKVIDKSHYFSEQVGTLNYMSPQIVKKEPYEGQPADIWALGISLYVMVTGTFPFEARRKEDIIQLII